MAENDSNSTSNTGTTATIEKPAPAGPPKLVGRPPGRPPLAAKRKEEVLGDDIGLDQADPPRKPTVGDRVFYTLGDVSKNAGEVRPGVVTVVHKPDPENAGPRDKGQVNLVWFQGKTDDVNYAAQVLTVSRGQDYLPPACLFIAGVRYDGGGAPGTWRFADDE
jgi:hypothetical protein